MIHNIIKIIYYIIIDNDYDYYINDNDIKNCLLILLIKP